MFVVKQNGMRMLMGFSAFCFVLSLGACAHNENKGSNGVDQSEAYLTSINLQGEVSVDSVIEEHAQKAISAMHAGQLQEATEHFNIALNKNFSSSSLQLLNGINYHLRAIGGDNGLFDMAEQGYLAAIRFDKSNWTARYYLGMFYMDTKRYMDAQREFGAYVANNDSDPEALYYLARASYYSADPVTAHAAAMRLWDLMETLGSSSIDPTAMLRLLAMTKAAVNKPDEASNLVDDYLAKGGEVDHAEILRKRLGDWRHVYAQESDNAKQEVATEDEMQEEMDESDEMSGMEESDDEMAMEESDDEMAMEESDDEMAMEESDDEMAMEESEDEEEFDSDDAEFVESQMVAVDVVIIRSEEIETEAKGINLLNSLQLQFGDPLNGINAYNYAESRTREGTVEETNTLDSFDPADPTKPRESPLLTEALRTVTDLNPTTRSITRLISIPAVSYTLNILNEQGGRSEVLARPTLVARAGQTSEFFSGVEVSAAAVSGGAGDSVSIEKEIGLKLAITPEMGADGVVFLHVIAERTFLTQPSRSVLFEFRLDTTKTLVDANVAMKFGQTLILSGLNERITESNIDGVPVLQDVPFLKRLFSEESVLSQKRSVIILLTPRPASYLYSNPGSGLTTVGELNSRPEINQLSERYESWFKPMTNAQTILDKIATGNLYKYFQSRDIPADAWYKSDSHSLRMSENIKQLSI
jgi:general secretion pathway protein D